MVVPITPKHDWETVKAFAKKVAEDLNREEPELYIATMSKAKRKGKIYIDYLRNTRTCNGDLRLFHARARQCAGIRSLHWR